MPLTSLDPQEIDRFLARVGFSTRDWLQAARARDPNILGAGFGYKTINKIDTKIPAFRVYVRSKDSKEYIERTPGRDLIPARISALDGTATDVVGISNLKFVSSDVPYGTDSCSDRPRPVDGGCSIYSDYSKIDGTLGCRVSRTTLRKGTEWFLLSNAHVLVGYTPPSSNDTTQYPIYEPRQGGCYHSDDCIIGYLAEWVALQPDPDDGNPPPINTVDAAIGAVRDNNQYEHFISNRVIDIGAINGWRSKDHIYAGLPVSKHGAKTWLENGLVRDLKFHIYDMEDEGKTFHFENVFSCYMKAEPGDSGALIMTRSMMRFPPTKPVIMPHGLRRAINSNKRIKYYLSKWMSAYTILPWRNAIGLTFATAEEDDTGKELTWACYIDSVQDALDIEVASRQYLPISSLYRYLMTGHL